MASLGCRVVEQLEEVAATSDGAGSAESVTAAQTAFCEDRPLRRPLVGDACGHHHYHGSLALGGLQDGHGDGEADVRFAHADFVGEDDAGLVVKPAQDLRGGALLPVCVYV
jgi:hypothetical protein